MGYFQRFLIGLLASLCTVFTASSASSEVAIEDISWRYSTQAPQAPEVILSSSQRAEFTPSEGSLALGYGHGTLDVLITIPATGQRDYVLKVAPAFLDTVSLYWLDGGQLQQLHAGDHVAAADRPLFSRHHLFPIITSQPTEFLLRIQTTSTISARFDLVSSAELAISQQHDDLLYSIFFGMVLTALVVAIICGAWTRLRLFWIVSFYLSTFGLLQFYLNGFDQIYFYPESGGRSDDLLGSLTFLCCASIVWFTCHYLQLPKHFAPSKLVLTAIILVLMLGALVSLLGFYQYLAQPLMYSGLLIVLSCMVLPFAVYTKQPKEARLLLFTFLPILFAVLMQTLRNVGFLPPSFWTSHLWAISGIFQVVFVLIVLLTRLSDNERELQRERRLIDMQQSFYRMMAHELRTPLAVASSALTNIRLRIGTATPDLDPRFTRAEDALKNLSTMVDQLLFEHRDDHIGLADDVVCDLNNAVSDAISITQQLSRHQLRERLLPYPLLVHGDQRMLTLAVLNVLENAVKYTPEDGLIKVTSSIEDGQAVVTIDDTGIGIPEQHREGLFTTQFRAANVPKHSSGLGLGLYLVARTLAIHHGHIDYAPLQPGSRFQLRLPLAEQRQ